MKIALVTFYRLSEAAGVSTFVSCLQRSLEERGHRTVVIEPGDTDWIGPTPGSTHPGRYAINLRRIRTRKGVTLKALIAFYGYLPFSLYGLWSFLRRKKIEVVHLHFPMPAALYFCILRLVSTWRLVVTFHGSDIYTLGRRPRRYRTLLRIVLSAVDLITTVSADVLRAVRHAYPRLRVPSQVILNGNPLAPSNGLANVPDGLDSPFALAVGSLIVRKGYDVLVRAVRLAKDSGREMRLVIIGDGPEREALIDLSRTLAVNDLVRFVGEIRHQDIGSYYAAAKFFVHSAREEAQGLVLLEAMSRGKAVVATRVNGIPELVRDEVTGLLVDSDDPAALAEAMSRFDEDPALCERFGERGREIVQRDHSWSSLTDHYLNAYEQVLKRRG